MNATLEAATLYDSPNLLECETCGESFSALDSLNECRACAAERAEAERSEELAEALFDAEIERNEAYADMSEAAKEMGALMRELAAARKRHEAAKAKWEAKVGRVAELKAAQGE